MPGAFEGIDIIVVNMLESARPTGMGIAGEAVQFLLRELHARECPRWLTGVIRLINNSVPSGVARMFCRSALAQAIPLLLGRTTHLLFTSHHAPFWRTGRHSVIVHDLISIDFPFQHRSQTIYFLLFLERLLRSASHVIFISHSVAAKARRHLPGLYTSNAWVIPSYNQRLAAYSASKILLDSRIAARRFLVVGARFPHKNLGLILEAAAKLLVEIGSDFLISVMGCDDSLWAPYDLQMLKARGVIETFDYAEQAEVERAYREGTALIYVSLAEGQGLPPLEAMAHGCPVIAADVEVLRETCGEAAIYVSPIQSEDLAAKLHHILCGDLNEQLKLNQQAGFTRAQLFSGESLTKSWSDFVSSLPLPSRAKM